MIHNKRKQWIPYHKYRLMKMQQRKQQQQPNTSQQQQQQPNANSQQQQPRLNLKKLQDYILSTVDKNVGELDKVVETRVKLSMQNIIEQRTKYYVDQRIGLLLNNGELLGRGCNKFDIDTIHNYFRFMYNGATTAYITNTGYLYCKNIWLNGINVVDTISKIFNTESSIADNLTQYVRHIDLKNGTYELYVKDTVTKHLTLTNDTNTESVHLNYNDATDNLAINFNEESAKYMFYNDKCQFLVPFVSNTDATPAILAVNNGGGNWITGAQVFAPNLSSGKQVTLKLGKSNNTGNTGYLVFYYDGSNSVNNYIGLGMHGSDQLYRFYRDRVEFYKKLTVEDNSISPLRIKSTHNTPAIVLGNDFSTNNSLTLRYVHNTSPHQLGLGFYDNDDKLTLDTNGNTNISGSLAVGNNISGANNVSVGNKLTVDGQALITSLEVARDIIMTDTFKLYTNYIQPIPNTGNNIYMSGRVNIDDAHLTLLNNNITTNTYQSMLTIGKWYDTNNLSLDYYYDENIATNCGWRLSYTSSGVMLNGDGNTTTVHTQTLNHLANASDVTQTIGKDNSNRLTITHSIDYNTNPVTFKLTRYNQAETDVLKLYGTTVEVPSGNALKLDNTSLSSVAKSTDVGDASKETDNTLPTTAYIKNTVSALIQAIYPVGSIYMSMVNVNPGTLFGGTWTELQNKFLYCVPTSSTSGDTGGASTHNHEYKFRYTLYNDNIGGYVHNGSDSEGNYGGFGCFNYDTNTYVYGRQSGSSPGNIEMTHSGNAASSWQMKSAGNTSYASNLPPYVTVYAWYRTA